MSASTVLEAHCLTSQVLKSSKKFTVILNPLRITISAVLKKSPSLNLSQILSSQIQIPIQGSQENQPGQNCPMPVKLLLLLQEAHIGLPSKLIV